MSQELSKEELLDKIERVAQQYELGYRGCARCTLLTLQENLKLGDDLTVKAATPLAVGIALVHIQLHRIEAENAVFSIDFEVDILNVGFADR